MGEGATTPSHSAGVSGTGDIMLTCFVNLSRNRTVGVRLGAGETLEEVVGSMTQVAEGVATAAAVVQRSSSGELDSMQSAAREKGKPTAGRKFPEFSI